MRLKFRARIALTGTTVTLLIVYTFWSAGSQPTDLNDIETDLPQSKFLLLTVATNDTANYRRFIRSAKVNGLPFKVLGFHQKWRGFGEKLLWLRDELKKHKNFKDRVILFSDSNDVLINGQAEEFLEKFKRIGARILFSAETNLWPDFTLADRFPEPKRGKKFLNSGLFIGYAADLYQILATSSITYETDDQLFYQMLYTDENRRRELDLRLDHLSEIFQNLEGGQNNVELRFEGEKQYILNKDYDTQPLVIHTPGNCKYLFHIIKNYIPKIWKPSGGCSECLEDVEDLTQMTEENYPSVVMAVFIERTPLLEDFFENIQMLDYPKEKIRLLINNELKYKTRVVNNFIKKYGAEYENVKLIVHERSNISKRDIGIEECVKTKCDFYLNIESVAQLDNPQSLRLLIEQNRQVLAPMLFGSGKGQKNFRGVDASQEYCRNAVKIVKDNDRGLLSVGVVAKCYLIRGDVIHNAATRPVYGHHDINDPDVMFSELMDSHDIELFASNRYDFGRLVM